MTGPPADGFDPSPVIAPSILAADFADLGGECRMLCEGGARWIHVDVMDGRFVPEISFGAQMVGALRPHVAGIMDVHLMVADPDRELEKYLAARPDYLTIHVETAVHLHRCLSTIRSHGAKAGVALGPATPVSLIEEVLDLVDLVCIMTVNPGFGGQSFIASMLDKIARMRSLIADRPARLLVDGGVSMENAGAIHAAGANVLVAGTTILGAPPAGSASVYAARIAELGARAKGMAA